jgi:hypothetical protein
MDKAIKDYLRPGEQILWESRTIPFKLLGKWDKGRILRSWIITAVCFVVIMAVYFRFNANPSAGLIGLFVLIAAMIAVSPVLERQSLLGQRYFITDKRAIVMTRGKSFYYVTLKRAGGGEVISGLADGDCIAIGRGISESARKQLRWQCCHPKRSASAEDHDCVSALAFYCPENPEGAISAIGSAGKRAA